MKLKLRLIKLLLNRGGHLSRCEGKLKLRSIKLLLIRGGHLSRCEGKLKVRSHNTSYW
jgi:hypothetical protein